MNRPIPQAIALLCYDDIDIFKFCNPLVTAIAQTIEESGKYSAGFNKK